MNEQKWQQVVNLCNQFAQEQECTFAMQGFIIRLRQILMQEEPESEIVTEEEYS